MEKYTIKQTEINVESLINLDSGIININYPIGAAYDKMPSGSAHFLEHIMCSTNEFPYGKLTAETKRDETSYYFYVSKNDIDSLFYDMNWQGPINENILEKERNIIKNEINQFNLNPRNLALEYLQFLLFNGEVYGKSILGDNAQISQINKSDLEKGIELYRTPTSINIIGPWEKDYIMELIEKSNVIGNLHMHSNKKSIAIGMGVSSLPENINMPMPFIGGAWFLNINKTAQLHIHILKSIWEARIKRVYPDLFFTLRINLYNNGGILTIDSNSHQAEQSQMELVISCIKVPISIKEFNIALVKQYIRFHKLSEDLQTRIHSHKLNPKIFNNLSLEEIQKLQQSVLTDISYETGFYLISDYLKKDNILYRDININNSKKENKVGLLDSENSKNETRKTIKELNPSISIFRREDFYYTISSSPLTMRYHLLLRLDCKGIGRLLLLNEFPTNILISGTLEYVRYEGWHTLFHLTFFDEKSMKGTIKNLLSHRWASENKPPNIHHKQVIRSLEVEMKMGIIKAFKTPTKKNEGLLKGISILTPEGSSINDNYFENFIPERIQPIKIEEDIMENKIIKSSFYGVALICRLPKQNLCSLILQETAFGINNVFPTLESLVREKGLSYRIVQSLISDEGKSYIFWGIQCEPNCIGSFKNIVREWLSYLYEYSDEIETWFKKTWSYFKPHNHNSILQLIRDIDRMGYYTQYRQQDLTLNINFKEFINEIKLENLREITFTK